MRSPEFPDGLRWLNSQPIKMRDLRGLAKPQGDNAAKQAVVLIDFWTYSCVNCLRTLPHVKEWHRRYSDKGLTIVGVHTPEFEFEKNLENVERAVKEFGIEYPVVMDNDYQVWSLYSNNFWPRKFLIDKEGQMVYDYAGEGGYRETEEAIQKALLELNPELRLPEPINDKGAGGMCYPTTQEIYLGSMRGSTRLTAGGRKVWDHIGTWKVFPEYIEHERKTQIFSDYIMLNFQGTEVNLVMESSTDRAAKVRLELDGKHLRDIEVREAKMYNLISLKDIITENGGAKINPGGTLKIFSNTEELRAYAFTFGGCA